MEKYFNLRTDAVWEKSRLLAFYRYSMKLGIFLPNEKKYIIKKLILDNDQDGVKLTDKLDRNEYTDFEGISTDFRTQNFQICKFFVNLIKKSLFHSSTSCEGFFPNILFASRFLASLSFAI